MAKDPDALRTEHDKCWSLHAGLCCALVRLACLSAAVASVVCAFDRDMCILCLTCVPDVQAMQNDRLTVLLCYSCHEYAVGLHCAQWLVVSR